MHPEMQYLNTLREILDKAKRHENRTGVDTFRILGVMHKYDFKHGFPLFTTKRTWWKGIKVELLWFLRGESNIKYLVDNGVGIWTDDAYRWYTRDMVEKWRPSKEHFVHRIKQGHMKDEPELGDIGPVYGVQWRRWRGEYGGPADCVRRDIDQIQKLVHDLKNNPSSRRHIISAWNAADIDKMGLPPCHIMSQFTIDEGKLWCHMYQRSCDMFLGVPFNVASYSLLTHMIAHVTGLEPGGFIHTMHDCHIYTNHIEAVEEQLTREPNPFPKLVLSEGVENIDDFTLFDIALEDYNPHKAIKAQLNVG